MINSVRGCVCTGEVESSRLVYRLSVFAQVTRDIPGLLRNQEVLLILGLLAILVIAVVIFPAVWSSKKTHRTAALDVLDRLLRWRR